MLSPDRARDLVARRELVDEALAVGVEQRRALAADRLGDQEALAARDAGDRGRVELHELEVGERGAGGVGEQQPDAERAGRVGRARPERGRAAGGEDRSRARGSRGRPRRRRRRSGRRWIQQRGGARRPRGPRCRGSSATSGARAGATMRRPVALPPAWTMRRREWPPSRPSARLPWRSASKCTPRRSRSRDARAAPRRQSTRGGARRTSAAPGALGVLAGAARASRRRPARRRGRPGPSSSRSARAAWRETSATRAPVPRGGQRGVETGGAGADDDDVGLDALRGAAMRGYGTRDAPRRSCFATRRRCEHDTGAHPERAARIVAIERELGARDWLGCERARVAARSRARGARRRAPGRATSRAIARALRGRAAARSTPTRSSSQGSYEAALHAAGGAVALVDALLGGDGAASAPRCTARRAITPSRRARWASACSTTSRSPPGTRSTRTGSSGC